MLYALMDFIGRQLYFPIVDRLEDRLDTIEEEIFSGQRRRAARSSGSTSSSATCWSRKRAVSPLVDICNRLMRFDRPTHPGGHAAPTSATSTTTPSASTEPIDTLRELRDQRARGRSAADLGRPERRITKQLAAWAAIIAVPTMIAGIYGMNFEFMPETPLAVRLSHRRRRHVRRLRPPLLALQESRLAVMRCRKHRMNPDPASPPDDTEPLPTPSNQMNVVFIRGHLRADGRCPSVASCARPQLHLPALRRGIIGLVGAERPGAHRRAQLAGERGMMLADLFDRGPQRLR